MVVVNHEAPQHFGLMRVEIIEDKNMWVFGMTGHHSGNVLSKVVFRPGRILQHEYQVSGDGPGFMVLGLRQFGCSPRPPVAPLFHRVPIPPGFSGNGLIAEALRRKHNDGRTVFQMLSCMGAFRQRFQDLLCFRTQTNARCFPPYHETIHPYSTPEILHPSTKQKGESHQQTFVLHSDYALTPSCTRHLI